MAEQAEAHIHVYGRWIDACNYERLTIERTPNGEIEVRSEAAGCGVRRAVRLIDEEAGDETVVGKSVGSDWRIIVR